MAASLSGASTGESATSVPDCQPEFDRSVYPEQGTWSIFLFIYSGICSGTSLGPLGWVVGGGLETRVADPDPKDPHHFAGS